MKVVSNHVSLISVLQLKYIRQHCHPFHNQSTDYLCVPTTSSSRDTVLTLPNPNVGKETRHTGKQMGLSVPCLHPHARMEYTVLHNLLLCLYVFNGDCSMVGTACITAVMKIPTSLSAHSRKHNRESFALISL